MPTMAKAETETERLVKETERRVEKLEQEVEHLSKSQRRRNNKKEKEKTAKLHADLAIASPDFNTKGKSNLELEQELEQKLKETVLLDDNGDAKDHSLAKEEGKIAEESDSNAMPTTSSEPPSAAPEPFSESMRQYSRQSSGSESSDFSDSDSVATRIYTHTRRSATTEENSNFVAQKYERATTRDYDGRWLKANKRGHREERRIKEREFNLSECMDGLQQLRILLQERTDSFELKLQRQADDFQNQLQLRLQAQASNFHLQLQAQASNLQLHLQAQASNFQLLLKGQTDELAESRASQSVINAKLERYTDIANWVRMRFFDTYKRDRKFTPDYSTISAGNYAAHHGMIELDSLLYLDGKRGDVAVFREIYGISPTTFQQRYQKYKDLVPVFNGHATIAAAIAFQHRPRQHFLNAFRNLLHEVNTFIDSGNQRRFEEMIYDIPTSLGSAWSAYKVAERQERDYWSSQDIKGLL